MQRITLDSEISYIVTEEELKEIRADERAKTLSEFVGRFKKRNQFKQMTKAECINAMNDLAEDMEGGLRNGKL